MRKRRIRRGRYELAKQLHSASVAAAGEPNWPASGPTAAQLQAAADALETLITQIVGAENALQILRSQALTASKTGQDLMRRVDLLTSALYGPSGGKKIAFGLRPIDMVRSMPPAPKAPLKVKLLDGPKPGTLLLDWKRVANARYLAEAWDGDPEAEGSRLLLAMSETASKSVFAGLPVGTQVFARVRIIAGKRSGPWSKPLTRFVNG